MVKKIKGKLTLTEDTTFDEDIEVEGDIEGYFNLKVAGNIDARNIDARNIDAWNIDAWNIDAWNIDAWNTIFCEIIKLKDKTKGKIKSRAVIRKRSELEIKEWKSD